MDTRLIERIDQRLDVEDWDATVALGVDNFTYLSQCVLPFAENYPDRTAIFVRRRGGRSAIVCPYDWMQAIRDQGWEHEIIVYDENDGLPPSAAARALGNLFSIWGMRTGMIAMDMGRASHRFVTELARIQPALGLVGCDRTIAELRITKLAMEIQHLETAAIQSDKGIIGALHHLEGTIGGLGYTIAEFSERVRVHLIEFESSGIGHLATLQNERAKNYSGRQEGYISSTGLVRIDVTSHFLGYWSNGGRMVSIGPPKSQEAEAFQDNLRLKAVAEECLRPGTRCDEVWARVFDAGRRFRIPLWDQNGIGHGVGVSHREPPYLHSDDKSVLRPGMVLVLNVFTYGPSGELIHSMDTFEITQDGRRLMSWYKDWDCLYAVTGFRASH